jgi:predicted ribosome quality control (RQC) complex YloA/Tae2 family protein
LNNNRNERDFHRYTLEGEWIVLAGKTDEANDRLSLRVADPDDWWFHVKGMPGSHVVLRHRQDRTPDKSILRAAASIAAWHSKARNGGTTAVSMTRARHVSKPSGAKAGTVMIRKETVLLVKPGLPENPHE